MNFREYINEIKITELKQINTNFGIITWNKNKSFDKFKAQIEDRITMPHMTEQYLYKIIEKGINQKFNDFFLGTLNEEDDTCIIFARSQFLVIFNRAGKFIRSIRKITDLDKILCKTKSKIFEIKYGIENELTNFIYENDINLDKTEDGFLFKEIIINNELMLEVNKLCRFCVEINDI